MTNEENRGIVIRLNDEVAALAQLDRVFGYEPKGRGFESLTPRQKSAPSAVADAAKPAGPAKEETTFQGEVVSSFFVFCDEIDTKDRPVRTLST